MTSFGIGVPRLRISVTSLGTAVLSLGLPMT
jgi:hypothetical protein